MANIARPESYNNWNKLLWDTGKMSYVEIWGKRQGSAKPEDMVRAVSGPLHERTPIFFRWFSVPGVLDKKIAFISVPSQQNLH